MKKPKVYTRYASIKSGFFSLGSCPKASVASSLALSVWFAAKDQGRTRDTGGIAILSGTG